MTPSLRRSGLLVVLSLTAPLLVFASPADAQPPRTLGIDTTSLDRTVRPQDDFFHFVNGGWLRRTPIPDDAASWGSFDELAERSRDAMRAVLEDAARSNAPAGSEERKVGDYYASFLDSARVESLGVAPLRGELARIAAISSAADLPAAFAHLARIGVVRPLAVGVGSDQKHSSENAVYAGQSGLGLPDRDYYLKTGARMDSVRRAYVAYETQLFTLADLPDPAGAAERVLALETALAERQWDRVRTRDPNATYNRMTVARLASSAPHFAWTTYLDSLGVRAAREIIVQEPDYMVAVDSLVATTPIVVDGIMYVTGSGNPRERMRETIEKARCFLFCIAPNTRISRAIATDSETWCAQRGVSSFIAAA